MKDKTPKTNKMKDKTPKTKAENPVNIPTAFASTTDTVRDGEPNNQTLPQADALKDRFKAGSIPLQTDFADLIDIANIGRQAVGGAEGQAGPANGFNLSSTGRLELKYKADKGISVDEDGVGVKAGHGVAANSDGVNVKLAKGDTYDNGGGGQGTDGTTDGAAGGLYVGANGLCVDAGDGMQLNTKGVSIKLAKGSGLFVDEANGLRVVPGNGLTNTSVNVSIRLSNGADYSNGGGGHGSGDFITAGNAGGLHIGPSGLCVDAGDGMQLNHQGVSIKLAPKSGLSADEANGLGITTGNGLDVNAMGSLELKPKVDNGISVDKDGVGVKAGHGMQIDGNGVSIKLAKSSGLSADKTNGLRIANHAWIKIMCDFYNADFYAEEAGIAVFFCNYLRHQTECCVAYVLGRGGQYMANHMGSITLNSLHPTHTMTMSGVNSEPLAVSMLSWHSRFANGGDEFKCSLMDFMSDEEYYDVILKLVAAPRDFVE